MIDLMPEIREWLAAGEDLAVATVVRVAGSAPRQAGARMIVSSEGRMAGSVSGGCVETTVYEEMMDLLRGGPPRLLHFGITEDMIWDVGLACGGTIDVFVQRLEPAVADAVARAVAAREPTVLATIVAGQGIGRTAVVGRRGAMHRVLEGSEEKATPDQALTAAARQLLAAQDPRGKQERRSDQGLVRAIGPDREVFFETFLPAPRMIIIGGVHVAIPLTRFAKELGFEVVVVDPRAKFANRERFPEADEVFQEWPDEALAHLTVDESTYIVLLTHDPKIDEPTLAAAMRTPAAYVGAIGSRKTHAGRRERMASWGITPEDLQRVYGPIGLDLGGRSPQETALAIIAEVIAVKNGKSAGFLRDG